MNKQNVFSEIVAEDAASTFLEENVGASIFIGADIEKLVAQSSQVVYQDIDDPKFFGALIDYKDRRFVVLNTHQDLRARYYSAAHEMWHLALISSMFGRQSESIKHSVAADGFDMERAADHFAAALMLPKAVMIKTWDKYVQDQKTPNPELVKEAVIRIANVSSMPYMAVYRRLNELGLVLGHDLSNWNKEKWHSYLEKSEFPPSPLDEIVNFKKFTGLSSFIKKQIDDNQMTLIEAANFLTNADPDQAIRYLKLRKEKIDDLSEKDDD